MRKQPKAKTVRKTVTTIEVFRMIAKKCHRKIYSTPPAPTQPKVVVLRKQTGEERRMELWT